MISDISTVHWLLRFDRGYLALYRTAHDEDIEMAPA